MDKTLPAESKSHPQTTVCMRERTVIIGHVAGTVLQLSSRLPRLLSSFPEATKFIISAFILHGKILCFRVPSGLVAFELFLFGLVIYNFLRPRNCTAGLLLLLAGLRYFVD
jgi:hypothetical protein